jgi:hypothetical protein
LVALLALVMVPMLGASSSPAGPDPLSARAIPDAPPPPLAPPSAPSGEPAPNAAPEPIPAGPAGTMADPVKAGCTSTSAAAFTSGAAPGGFGSEPVAVAPAAGRRVPVSSSAALSSALRGARPGDTIELAPGHYSGKFVASGPAGAAAPITVVGSCASVLDGGPPASGYALHLVGADHWRLAGFTVTGAQKGIMVERSGHTVLSHLTVGNVGQEAVHLYNFSSDNVVQRSLVHDTGTVEPRFGEGLYLGSAESNWATRSGGKPDESNRNRALGNTFRHTAAENIDVKEATSGGLIAGNAFDGSAVSGQNSADSVLDVKGVRYRVVDNRTTGTSPALKNGFQTHVITDPATSGCNNIFSGNTFAAQFVGGQAITLDKKCS